MSPYKKLKVKYIIGQRPDGMAAEWMTDKDWEKHEQYVEKCRRDGTLGKEAEAVMHLKKHKGYNGSFNNTGLIIDFNKITKLKLKPLKGSEASI
jgi:hypothetical protein